MRNHVINTVIDAIQGHEVKNVGFNMTAYVSSSVIYKDWTGTESSHVCDIAGWTAMLFTSTGVRRPKPLSIFDLSAMAIQNNLVEHMASAMDISEEEATSLCAPWLVFNAVKLNPNLIPLDVTLDVLHHFVATGNVEWGELLEVAA